MQSDHSIRSNSGTKRMVARSIHTAFNICLFPPLFFFSALYYTDVLSTVSVLLSYRLQKDPSLFMQPRLRGTLLFVNGLIALTFRQTNIFWVAVFPAFLDTVRIVEGLADVAYSKCGHPGRHPWRSIAHHSTIYSSISQSWNGKILFNLPFSDSFCYGQ